MRVKRHKSATHHLRALTVCAGITMGLFGGGPDHQDDYDQVYGDKPHDGSFTHEMIGGGACNSPHAFVLIRPALVLRSGPFRLRGCTPLRQPCLK